jgi:Carboxypeptidase regulatory-like domain
MLRNRLLSICAVLLCVLALSVVPAWGQATNTGTVSGTVSDNSGAVVGGASVTLTDKATNDTRSTTTNADGRYIFVSVDPGTYSLKFSKSGFAETEVASIKVEVATALTENVQMKLGAVSTTVVVTETPGAELQTMNSTVGQTIEHNELLQLPNASRDATTFATLQPGTNINGNTAGAVVDQNTFTLDGGNITDDMSGDSDVYVLSFSGDTSGVGAMHSPGNNAAPSGVVPAPVESIEEFKVGVANQTADFNGGAGGEVQMATKKGTASFHGAVYEYYLDNNFVGANTWDDNNTGTLQPSAHYHRFGANAGGPLLPGQFLGGRTFIFGDYEGYRNPSAESFDRSYPTPLMRSGMIGLNGEVINLNPVATPVPAGMPATFYGPVSSGGFGVAAGQMIAPTPCPASGNGLCDPRGLGLNPVICTANGSGGCSAGLWSLTPLPNDYTHGDGVNYAGYKGVLALPDTSNFGVTRIDHDFGSRWHFNGTYHYYHRIRTVANQVDVGGVFPGDTLGQYKSVSTRPQNPWFYTASMTTNISSTMTNNFTYSGTRNWWAYNSLGGVPNVAGYSAALELGGETSGSLQPFNTDNQNTRWRYWNGHDNMFRDDVTKITGKHLVTFGGIYQRNYDAHLRIDNGGQINIYAQDIIGQGTGTSLPNIEMTPYIPAGITNTNKYGDLYAEILGMVTSDQALYTRSNGTTLALKPQTSCAIASVALTSGCMSSPAALNESIIPFYNAYFNDTWQMKPSFTLSYGLSYTVEMPPYSPNQAQDILVDANNNIVSTADYLSARAGAAAQGQAYDPELGFSTINNVNGHPKYPYSPFYHGLSPRISAAWNPHFSSDSLMGHIFGTGNTVLRGGWARIYGRLNGVDQVLVPILAPGLMQTVQCYGPNRITLGCGALGGGKADVTDIFRTGVDGTTAPITAVTPNLPQPWYPGVNDVATGSGEALDPNFKPNRSDEFNFSIQRQINPKVMVEVGYIGRIIRNEYIAYDLNNVPYMMSQGGQTFANAWATLTQQTSFGANIGAGTPQPFFEQALGGPTSAYCTGFSSCTAAFLKNEGGNLSDGGVWDAWTDLSTAGAFTFGRTMLNDPIAGSSFGANGSATDIFENESNGYGNYSGGYIQASFADWHGISMKTNLTMSKSLGTQAVVQASSEITTLDPYNVHASYGVQPFDETWAYNLYFTYNPPWYREQQGLAGRVLGGWSISPLFVAGSGFPVEVQTANGNGESFGEGDENNESGLTENGILIAPLNYTNSRKRGVNGSNNVGTAGAGQNVFTDPASAIEDFRNPILGLDTKDGGAGPLRGLPFWNMSMSIDKNIKFTERLNLSVYAAFTNLFNHMQPADPTFALYDPTTFGVIGGGGNVQGNTPRQTEFGIRLGW